MTRRAAGLAPHSGIQRLFWCEKGMGSEGVPWRQQGKDAGQKLRKILEKGAATPRLEADATPSPGLSGRIPMRDGRLLGPLLLLCGSAVLAYPETLPQGLPEGGASLAGLVMLGMGCVAAALGWRRDLADASFHAQAAMRHMARGAGRPVPARRMTIRIRCARP